MPRDLLADLRALEAEVGLVDVLVDITPKTHIRTVIFSRRVDGDFYLALRNAFPVFAEIVEAAQMVHESSGRVGMAALCAALARLGEREAK